jgi:hypothetical protein
LKKEINNFNSDVGRKNNSSEKAKMIDYMLNQVRNDNDLLKNDSYKKELAA